MTELIGEHENEHEIQPKRRRNSDTVSTSDKIACNDKTVEEGFEFISAAQLIALLDSQRLGAGVIKQFMNYAETVELFRSNKVTGGDSVFNSEKVLLEERLLELGWIKLNTGHFSEVEECWRIYYSAVSYLKAVRLYVMNDNAACLRSIDNGLLMGRELRVSQRKSVLADLAENVIQCMAPPEPLSPFMEVSVASISKSLVAGEVPVYSHMAEEDFLSDHVFSSMPLLFKGAYKNWDAVEKWSWEYLNNKIGHRTVPVEIGSRYTDDNWSQKLMLANEFFRQITGSIGEAGPMYLAQHRLLDQIPSLRNDFSIPEYCLSSGNSEEEVDLNIWIGPSNTKSPLHTDPRENMFCQIAGRKFVRLISPNDGSNVYPIQDGILTNTSQVDVEAPDLMLFPEFSKAKCYDVIVEPGDALFIPKGWWHYVRSLSPSISISFWFDAQ